MAEKNIENHKDEHQIISQLKNFFTPYKSQFNDLDDNPYDTLCLLCNCSYILPTNEKDFLAHLFKEHHLVIGDVNKIASLKSYIRYWRMKFQDEPLSAFCTTLTLKSNDTTSSINSLPVEEGTYFLLSDCIMEDKTLRDELHRAKLEWVLQEQVKERADTTFKRGCMYCRMEFSGSCIEYIKHLNQKHNILLGKPENLVFINDYLNKIQNNLERFICIYCEKQFKNRFVLKEHMRKKLHKQVNPNNKSYDKYYVTNYLFEKSGNNKKKCMKLEPVEEDPSGFSSDDEDDWSDWNNETINITCLFCTDRNQDFDTVLKHMILNHEFNYEDITKEFTFYEKVKIVNYIRNKIYTSRCIYCDETTDNLILHMKNMSHYKLPQKEIWNRPEFYFPMFDNDSFLYSLDTDSDSDEKIS